MSAIPPPPAPRPDFLLAARAAMLTEAAKKQTRWRTHALRLISATLGLAVLIIAIAGEAPTRWVSLVLLGAAAPVLAIAAVRPGSKALRLTGIALAAAGATAIVFGRPLHVEATSSSPEWLCTVLHVLAAGPAIVCASLLLRSMAANRLRTLTAALAVGTTGALMGEVLCSRSAEHVAVFHLSAWALVACAVAAVSLFTRRSSFAP